MTELLVATLKSAVLLLLVFMGQGLVRFVVQGLGGPILGILAS